jgi:hypothetical protein
MAGADAEATAARAAARARADAFLATVVSFSHDELYRTALGSASEPSREQARATAERLAEEHELSDLLTEARAGVERLVLERFSDGLYRPTMVGLNWAVSEGTAADRAATGLAAEDAMTAAVVEPYLDPDDLVALTSPFELIERGRAVDASFDLTRATSDALSAQRRDGSTRWFLAAVAIVLIGVLGVVTGIWAVVIAAAILVAGVVALARRTVRAVD